MSPQEALEFMSSMYNPRKTQGLKMDDKQMSGLSVAMTSTCDNQLRSKHLLWLVALVRSCLTLLLGACVHCGRSR